MCCVCACVRPSCLYPRTLPTNSHAPQPHAKPFPRLPGGRLACCPAPQPLTPLTLPTHAPRHIYNVRPETPPTAAPSPLQPDGRVAHFELVLCKSVDTYVRVKQNQNQVVWKWKKVGGEGVYKGYPGGIWTTRGAWGGRGGPGMCGASSTRSMKEVVGAAGWVLVAAARPAVMRIARNKVEAWRTGPARERCLVIFCCQRPCGPTHLPGAFLRCRWSTARPARRRAATFWTASSTIATVRLYCHRCPTVFPTCSAPPACSLPPRRRHGRLPFRQPTPASAHPRWPSPLARIHKQRAPGDASRAPRAGPILRPNRHPNLPPAAASPPRTPPTHPPTHPSWRRHRTLRAHVWPRLHLPRRPGGTQGGPPWGCCVWGRRVFCGGASAAGAWRPGGAPSGGTGVLCVCCWLRCGGSAVPSAARCRPCCLCPARKSLPCQSLRPHPHPTPRWLCPRRASAACSTCSPMSRCWMWGAGCAVSGGCVCVCVCVSGRWLCAQWRGRVECQNQVGWLRQTGGWLVLPGLLPACPPRLPPRRRSRLPQLLCRPRPLPSPPALPTCPPRLPRGCPSHTHIPAPSCPAPPLPSPPSGGAHYMARTFGCYVYGIDLSGACLCVCVCVWWGGGGGGGGGVFWGNDLGLGVCASSAC